MSSEEQRLQRIDTSLAKQLGDSIARNSVLAEENRKLRDQLEGLRYERRPDGTIDWKLEVERRNRDIARLDARVSELLQFNNEFEQRARDAEREMKRLTRQVLNMFGRGAL